MTRTKTPDWTEADIPPQRGRRAIITGTGGLGFEAARALAMVGARVVLAGRNAEKGRAAVAAIQTLCPTAKIDFAFLDLASLASVADFAGQQLTQKAPLDLLINNAGIMAPPERQTTADGFELQWGTNYLGHFALTAGLLPLLLQAEAPRVVNVSSLYHRQGKIFFDDLQSERSYRPYNAYGQSKLAMLMFTFELHRRAAGAQCKLISAAAHPGYARTRLIENGPGTKGFLYALNKICQPYVSQSAAEGTRPLLYAATSPDAQGGGYYGPCGFYELKGPPCPSYVTPQARNSEAAKKLWDISQAATQTCWPF